MAGGGRGRGRQCGPDGAAGAATATEKGKRGKTFVPEEERQLCCSVLHVSQDPVVGNG